MNLVNAASYNSSVREAWYDSFAEHNNWTKHDNKLCTADAAGFRLLLTNTNGANGPRGPFVAGYDKVYAGGAAMAGDGNDNDRRSNRVGWQNPRCEVKATPGTYKGYQTTGTGQIFANGGEVLTSIPAGAFNGIGAVNAPVNPAFEGGNNWGAQYRGPPSFCTGAGDGTLHEFTINRTKGGCAATGAAAAPCSTFNAAPAACAAAGCTHDGAAACEGQPKGCAAYTTAATCGAANNGCAWSESAATLGTVSSLGQCKRLCRSNIDCQAVTVLSWAPPQNWSDATVQGNGLAYPQGCMAADGTDLDDDDSCKGSKNPAAAKTASKICVLCPHTPGTLAGEPAAGAAGSFDSYRAGAATYVRSGRGSGRQMAIYDITVYKGSQAAGNSVNLVKEAGGRQLRRSLQEDKPRMSIVTSGGEVDEGQFKEAMADVMRANPHLKRFLAEEKVYPQRDEVIAANPTATSATTNSQAPTGPQANTKAKQSTENVASTSEEENMNSASRVLTTSVIALMSIYALLQ